jgi:hypothetical protein
MVARICGVPRNIRMRLATRPGTSRTRFGAWRASRALEPATVTSCPVLPRLRRRGNFVLLPRSRDSYQIGLRFSC